MKNESTISKINKDLISTFASLDAWFDKALDDGFDNDDQWNASDVIQHIVTSNHHLLDLLSDGYDLALAKFTNRSGSEAEQFFHAMRFMLREQLFHCLCLLDELDYNTVDADGSKEMNVYDKLSSLIHHLQYHLEHLERSDPVDS